MKEATSPQKRPRRMPGQLILAQTSIHHHHLTRRTLPRAIRKSIEIIAGSKCAAINQHLVLTASEFLLHKRAHQSAAHIKKLYRGHATARSAESDRSAALHRIGIALAKQFRAAR